MSFGMEVKGRRVAHSTIETEAISLGEALEMMVFFAGNIEGDVWGRSNCSWKNRQ